MNTVMEIIPIIGMTLVSLSVIGGIAMGMWDCYRYTQAQPAVIVITIENVEG